MTKSVKRLIEGFEPTHYDLHIKPAADKKSFSGQVTIRGKKVGRPSQRLTFHQNGLKVTSARAIKHDKKGDQDITFSRINLQKTMHEVRLHSEDMLYPGEYTVTMEFEAPVTPGMTGMYPCSFTHDGKEKVLLMTQFESHYAREAFPCIDEPAAKATFDLHITAPAHETVLGNTLVKSTEKHDDDTVTTSFETSPRMSTYLLAWVIGEIHSKSGKTKSGVDVNIWGTVAQPADSFDFALDSAIRCIEFFEDYFKVPYPLPKADHIAVPDFAAGAMENWGLITYREAVLLLYPEAESQSTKELISLVIAHETSHQWFGNLVTMKWWDDLWLNESFANMMEYEAVDAMYPDWNIWESFITAEAMQAWRRDATPGVQAVKQPVHHPDEISTLFDPSIVYAKGGRLLYMLKNYLGEAAFRKGLQAYFTKHAYGNTTGADLWAALSEASGIDVGAFMNPWLERSGFPVVSVKQDNGKVTLRQQHFLEDPAKADPDRLWPIPLFIEHPDAPILLETATMEKELAGDGYVLVNQAARGHYIVHYETPEHRADLIRRISSGKLGPVDRLNLLNSSAMLARSGMESFGETLRLLDAYSNETEESVWDIMSLILGDARRFIDADASLEQPQKKQAGKLIQAEYQRLGWNEQPGESAANQKLRATILGLGVYAEDPEIIGKALKLFDAYQKDASVAPAELVGIIFSAAVKHKHPGAVDYLLKLYKETTNSDLKRDISGGLTSTKDPEEAKKLLTLVQDPKTVKPQDADRWVFMLLRNRYTRATAWQWMEDNWAWVEKTYAQDKSYDYWPRFAAAVANTKELQERYQKFFEPKMDNLVLKRNIVIGLEEIQNRLDWLERDLKAVQDFYKSV